MPAMINTIIMKSANCPKNIRIGPAAAVPDGVRAMVNESIFHFLAGSILFQDRPQATLLSAKAPGDATVA